MPSKMTKPLWPHTTASNLMSCHHSFLWLKEHLCIIRKSRDLSCIQNEHCANEHGKLGEDCTEDKAEGSSSCDHGFHRDSDALPSESGAQEESTCEQGTPPTGKDCTADMADVRSSRDLDYQSESSTFHSKMWTHKQREIDALIRTAPLPH